MFSVRRDADNVVTSPFHHGISKESPPSTGAVHETTAAFIPLLKKGAGKHVVNMSVCASPQ